jgi:hypothetical protein
MCFTQNISYSLGLIGVISSYVMYINRYYYASIGIFYFSLMELLQGLQYSVIDDCANDMNIFLTYVGYLHICFQPVIVSIWLYEFIEDKKKNLNYLKLIIGICLAGAILLASRVFIIEKDTLCNPKTEPTCGEKTCSISGKYHIVWNFKLRAPGTYYFTPSVALHFFLYCVPFLVLGIILNNYKVIIMSLSTVFIPFVMYIAINLYLYLNDKETYKYYNNMNEIASLWCFVSIPYILLTFALLKLK